MPRHDVENPCCVCGKWGSHFKEFDTSKLSPVVIRKYVCGSLHVKYLCHLCTAQCSCCHSTVISQQCKLFNDKCHVCMKDVAKSMKSYKRK